MAQEQQGDVSLCQADDGGEINVTDGIVTMSGGLETAFYLSLFGGNIDDDVSNATISQWWGNGLETDNAFRYRSETQYLMSRLFPSSANLLLIEEAANRDVAWAKEKNLVTYIRATATIPEFNKIQIDLEANVVGEETTISFLENWKTDI